MTVQTMLVLVCLIDRSQQQKQKNDNQECEDEFCDFHCSVIYYKCGNQHYQKCSCDEEPSNIDNILEFFRSLGLIFYKPAKPIRPMKPPSVAESSVVLAALASKPKPAQDSKTNPIMKTTTTTTTTSSLDVIKAIKRFTKKKV
jgi:hypothetical protein